MQRLFRAIWMRGFGPAAALLVLGVANLWHGAGWQGPGGPLSKRVWITRGTVYLCRGSWPTTPSPRPAMTIGYSPISEGWTFWHRPLADPLAPNFAFHFYRPQIGVSFFWVALAAAVPPSIVWWRRSRRVPPGHCPTCRYNCAGLHAAAPCPECGAVKPEERSL